MFVDVRVRRQGKNWCDVYFVDGNRIAVGHTDRLGSERGGVGVGDADGHDVVARSLGFERGPVNHAVAGHSQTGGAAHKGKGQGVGRQVRIRRRRGGGVGDLFVDVGVRRQGKDGRDVHFVDRNRIAIGHAE